MTHATEAQAAPTIPTKTETKLAVIVAAAKTVIARHHHHSRRKCGPSRVDLDVAVADLSRLIDDFQL